MSSSRFDDSNKRRIVSDIYRLPYSLNATKSRNPYFGKRTTISKDIILNDSKVEWADEWPYLGVTLKSGKVFGCSVNNRIKTLYRCANAILRIDGRSNDMVMLHLIETVFRFSLMQSKSSM